MATTHQSSKMSSCEANLHCPTRYGTRIAKHERGQQRRNGLSSPIWSMPNFPSVKKRISVSLLEIRYSFWVLGSHFLARCLRCALGHFGVLMGCSGSSVNMVPVGSCQISGLQKCYCALWNLSPTGTCHLCTAHASAVKSLEFVHFWLANQGCSI